MATTTTMELDDALLVSDGFLVPGKDHGGLYIVKNPSTSREKSVCLTQDNRWFYHRSVWVDLTGDGRKSILTARARLRNPFQYSQNGSPADTELVMLEMPKPHGHDKHGQPVEEDGTPFDPFHKRHLPWKEQ